MPYASDAQRKLFRAKLGRGQMDASTVNEFDQASKGMKLPEHAKGPKPPKGPRMGGKRKGAFSAMYEKKGK